MSYDDDKTDPAAAPDPTGVCRPDHATRFKAGKSGNPSGRPKGSRNKLGERFLEALQDDFAQHGPATIVAMREADPGGYVRVIASLLPREVAVDQTGRFESDEALDAEIDRLICKLGYAKVQ